MSSDRVAALLVNERIAVREQRNSRREEIHNRRRAGLSALPAVKEVDTFDEAEMNNICAALRCGNSGSISVTQLRSLKHLVLHPEGLASFMKDRSALHGLIGVLSGKRPLYQLEAAYICVNLGLGQEEHCLPVCRAAGPYLIQFLEGTNYYLQEASAWAIGNLAGASNKCAAVITAQGAVLQLILLLSGPQKGLNLAASYAFIHIIHSRTLLQEDEMVELARISSSLLSTEPDICCLLYLLSCSPVCEKTLLEGGVVMRSIAILTELIDSVEKSVKTFTALLRTVGNLTSGLGGLDLVSNEDAGGMIRSLLTSPYKHLCKETAWICANLIRHENQNVRDFAAQAGLPEAMENYYTSQSSLPFEP